MFGGGEGVEEGAGRMAFSFGASNRNMKVGKCKVLCQKFWN